jgi:ADP-ribose pyrophosphatase YjhB (NUDIX family)
MDNIMENIPKTDISYLLPDKGFSYRVSGFLLRNGKLLLQMDNNEYAVPGGQVGWGETHEDALKREYDEEIGADVSVEKLVCVEENFYSYGGRDWQQICCDYLITLNDESEIPLDGSWLGKEGHITFHWVPVEQLSKIAVYPTTIPEMIANIDKGVQHTVYKE